MAIAQLKPAYDQDDNEKDLENELKLLKLGDYFMSSFYKQVSADAPHLKLKMPSMSLIF